MRALQGTRSKPWYTTSVCGAFAIAGAALFAAHLRNYFFLFDDFALIGEASTHDVGAIFRSGLFGFYRPLVFAMVKGEYAVAGWAAPWAYLLVSLACHLLNSVLLYALSRLLRASRASALIAACVFLLSPWSAESFLWVSGRFDLVATLCILVSLVCGMASMRTPRADLRGLAFGCGVGFAGLALLAKESGVSIPILFLLLLTAGQAPSKSLRVGVWYLAALSVVTAGALLARALLVPQASHVAWWSLVRQSDVVANYVRYLRALVVWPMPEGARALTVVSDLAWAGLGVALLAGSTLRKGRRIQSTRLIVAFHVTLVPVIAFAIGFMNSSGGRFLYLPGVWVALLVGTAFTSAREDRTRRTMVREAVMVASLVLLFGYQFASLRYQTGIWRQSSALSRRAVGQFERYKGERQPIYVENLPYGFAEGPYILKPYAFRYYYQDPTIRDVQARLLVLDYHRDSELTVMRAELTGELDGTETAVRLQFDDVRDPDSAPRLSIESPLPGAVLSQPFVVSGWAIDEAAASGTGVDAVVAWAHAAPSTGAAPVYLGVAANRIATPEVAAAHGPQFAETGYRLSVSGLTSGAYDIVVYGRSTVSGTFNGVQLVRVTVR